MLETNHPGLLRVVQTLSNIAGTSFCVAERWPHAVQTAGETSICSMEHTYPSSFLPAQVGSCSKRGLNIFFDCHRLNRAEVELIGRLVKVGELGPYRK